MTHSNEAFTQSPEKPPSDHHLSTGMERGQMDRHTEKPAPDHQLDVLQLMPVLLSGRAAGGKMGRVPAEGQGEKYMKPESSMITQC